MQHARKPHPLTLAIGLALATGSLSSALAQEAKPAEKNQLETVLITAERRVENIKDVPNAVSQLSGDKLDVLASGGQDVRFLSGRLPSLNIESSFGRAYPRFYIRGYGNTDFHLNASQPVSVLYDEVIQENPILKGFPVFDQRNVEVIAGPQGTLFGRNTPAGVVKFESVRPSHKQDGYLSLGAGTYGSYSLEGAANLPLSGDWAARISAQTQHRDNWVKNTNPAGPTQATEGYDDTAVRLQALYEPNKQFSALFNFHHRDLDGSPRLFRASIIKPGTNDLIDGFDPARVSLDGRNEQTLKQNGGSMRLKWVLPDVSLHAITGYESVKPFSRGDIDGASVYKFPQGPGEAAFPVETSDALSQHRQLSQELRLESTGAGPLRWQGGVYLFDEKYTIDSVEYLGSPLLINSTHQTNKAWAVFGSINYDLSSTLKMRGGLRYTSDKKDLSTTATVPSRLQSGGGTSTSTDDGKWTWDASLSLALSKETNVYVRAATGARGSSIQPAGEFNPMSVAGPESVRSVELGLKSEFWDRRARFSGALFDLEVKNQQFTAVGGGSNANRLINARKVSGRGVEFNLELLPIDDLLITMGGSYNDTQIKQPGLQVEACGSACTLLNTITVPRNPAAFKFSDTVLIDGNPLPQAPKWIYNLTARYTLPMADGSEFYVYTDWAYRSKVNFFLYQAKEFTGKALTEGGVRLGYIWGNGKYEAAVFGRNVTNQVRVTGAIDFNNLLGFINDPRTYGAQFKILF